MSADLYRMYSEVFGGQSETSNDHVSFRKAGGDGERDEFGDYIPTERRARIVQADIIQPGWDAIPNGFANGAPFVDGNGMVDGISMDLSPMGGGVTNGNDLPSSEGVLSAMSGIAGGAHTANSDPPASEGLTIIRQTMSRWREPAWPSMEGIAHQLHVPVFLHRYKGTDTSGETSLYNWLSFPFVNFALIRAMNDIYSTKPPVFVEEALREVSGAAQAAWPVLSDFEDAPDRVARHLSRDNQLLALQLARLAYLQHAMLNFELFGISRTYSGGPRVDLDNPDARTTGTTVRGRHKMINFWSYTRESCVADSRLYIILKRETVRIGNQLTERLIFKPHVLAHNHRKMMPPGTLAYQMIGTVASPFTEVTPSMEATVRDTTEFDLDQHRLLASLITCNAISFIDDGQFLPTSAVDMGHVQASSSYQNKEKELADSVLMQQLATDLGHIEVYVRIGEWTITSSAMGMGPRVDKMQSKDWQAYDPLKTVRNAIENIRQLREQKATSPHDMDDSVADARIQALQSIVSVNAFEFKYDAPRGSSSVVNKDVPAHSLRHRLAHSVANRSAAALNSLLVMNKDEKANYPLDYAEAVVMAAIKEGVATDIPDEKSIDVELTRLIQSNQSYQLAVEQIGLMRANARQQSGLPPVNTDDAMDDDSKESGDSDDDGPVSSQQQSQSRDVRGTGKAKRPAAVPKPAASTQPAAKPKAAPVPAPAPAPVVPAKNTYKPRAPEK